MAVVMKAFKVGSLPSTLEPNSMYIVSSGSNPYCEVYFTGASASVVKRVLTENDVINLINTYSGASNNMFIVNDIPARNALNPNRVVFALVLNATGDPTVSSGSASYVYNPSTNQWIKVAEYESMDLVINWNNIVGRPSSSPAAIDDAVNRRHSHANMAVLDQLSEPSTGVLAFRGNPVGMYWSTVQW